MSACVCTSCKDCGIGLTRLRRRWAYLMCRCRMISVLYAIVHENSKMIDLTVIWMPHLFSFPDHTLVQVSSLRNTVRDLQLKLKQAMACVQGRQIVAIVTPSLKWRAYPPTLQCAIVNKWALSIKITPTGWRAYRRSRRSLNSTRSLVTWQLCLRCAVGKNQTGVDEQSLYLSRRGISFSRSMRGITKASHRPGGQFKNNGTSELCDRDRGLPIFDDGAATFCRIGAHVAESIWRGTQQVCSRTRTSALRCRELLYSEVGFGYWLVCLNPLNCLNQIGTR